MANMSVVQYMIGHYGGAERFFVRLCRALADRDVRQHLIINDDPEFVSLVEKASLPFTIIKTRKYLKFLDRNMVRRVCTEQNANIIVAWMSRAARRLPSGKIVRIGRLGGWYPVRHYRKCDHLIGNSPSVYDFIVQSDWPITKASLISNFAAIKSTKVLTREGFGIEPNKFIILAMGRFHPSKGFDILIKAIQPLPHVHVLLAGQGNQEKELRSLADALGVSNRVSFLGWRDDIADLYAFADAFVIPSREEPLGNVVLEAWSMRVPVISSNSEGPGWLIQNGINGLMYQKEEYIELTKSIYRLLNDRLLQQTLVDNAFKKWSEHFSEDAICNQYIELFKNLMMAKGV